MISYGGVYLCDDEADLAPLGDSLSLADLRDFARRTWPGRLASLGWPWLEAETRPMLNRLVWPQGASRWAMGWFVADDTILAALRPLAYSGGTLNVLPLVLDDGGTSVKAPMYLLPPRPIYGVTGEDALYLLCLVDQRYFWWEKAAVVSALSSWAGLFSALGTALGLTITVDAIDSAYLTPPGDFNTQYEYLPPQLDAAARSVGKKVYVGLDGSVSVIGPATAKANFLGGQAGTLGQAPQLTAGGLIDLTNDQSSDLAGVLPASVTVVFPGADANGAPTGQNVASVVTLASLAASLPQYGGAATNPNSHVLYSSVLSGSGNTAQIASYAQAAARDWYAWQQAREDEALAGVWPWAPGAMEDRIEWSLRGGSFWTRVQRPPWNERWEEMLASGASGSLSQYFFNLLVQNFYTTSINLKYTVITLLNVTYNNYSAAGQSKIAFSPSMSGASAISGFAGGTSGQLLYVWNVGPGPLTLLHQSAGSAAGNKIFTPLRHDYVLWANSGCILEYDTLFGDGSGNAVWRFDEPTFGAENLDASAVTYGCRQLKANNDLGTGHRYGRLEALDNADGTSTWNWQGIKAYLAGTGLIGPAADLEFVAGSNVTLSLSLDAAAGSPTGTDALKLTIAASGGGGSISLAKDGASSLNVSLTTDNVWVDGPSLTIAAAGTYFIFARITGGLSVTATAQIDSRLLQNGTAVDGIGVGGNAFAGIVAYVAGALGGADAGSISFVYLATVGNGDVFKIQARRSPTMGVYNSNPAIDFELQYLATST